MTFDEFSELDHAGIFQRCVNKLRAKYPASDAEEYVGIAMLKLTEQYQNVSTETAEGWVYTVAHNALRRREGRKREAPSDFSLGIEDQSLDLDPIRMDIERTRRARQAAALSDTLRTFVRECENAPPTERSGKRVDLRWKECMERHFLGQSDDEIRHSMRQYDGSSNPKNLIEKDRSRAWDQIEAIKQTHDVRNTLFTADPKQSGSSPAQDGGLRQPQISPISEGENPLPTGEAARDTMLLADWFPDVTTSKIFYILLTRDTQAYCPSETRLQRFAQWHATTKDPSRAICPDDLLDIAYHVMERECRFCASTLDLPLQ